jgi:DNA-directed RNA polymerase specialized sigma24 family protein
MRNPFAESAVFDHEDRELVRQAQSGNREALEQLITRHQAWIYNIVLRMVYLPQDAEDATQEIVHSHWSYVTPVLKEGPGA